MQPILILLKSLFLLIMLSQFSEISADNQTPDISPIFSEQELPFRVSIELADFQLPNGLQSYDLGIYKGKWLLINGRTNGLHGFNDNPNNFPPTAQNRVLYVVDPIKKTVVSRSLTSSHSGLSQDQIDSLSVTDTQSYQIGNTLYLTGGYGFRTALNNFTTFDVLTAIDIPGLMQWVTQRKKSDTVAHHIRQIFDPVFKITGGSLYKLGKNKPFLLIFGQDFEGTYLFNPTQVYSEQVRRFQLYDDGKHLSVDVKSSKPLLPDVNFRRRDLNIVPILSRNAHGKLISSLVALSGVFTPSNGVWTVPVSIDAKGHSLMADPIHYYTFKQGMNNYFCPTVGLYSKQSGDMYTIIFGGLSYGFFQNNIFETDPSIPFINQVTTIKIDKCNHYTQHLMNEEYPLILSTQSNPGNPLLFGTTASFIPAYGLEKLQYENGVFKLDQLKKPLLIGYIVGGIQSTLPDTITDSDSAASPYIFKVKLYPLNESSSSSDS